MRIGIVSHFPPPPGGMPGQAEALLQGLRREGVTALPIRTNVAGGRMLTALEGIRFFRTFLRWPIFLVRLLATLPKVDALAVFSCSGVSFFLFTMPSVLIGSAFRRRIVVHYHGGAAETFFQQWLGVVHFVLSKAGCIVVPSPFLVNVFRKISMEAVVVPNVLELERFVSPSPREILPRFVIARHLEEDYNVACAIRAFALVRKLHPQAELFVLGNGSQQAMLKRLVLEQDLLESVHFLGYVPNDRVTEVYSKASIALNSSSVDNLPVFLLEAFAAGMPVVTTCAGGIPFLVEDGRTGLLVGLNDHEAMAEKILLLLRNPDFAKQLAKNAREEVSRYAWPAIFVELARVYGIPTAPESVASFATVR